MISVSAGPMKTMHNEELETIILKSSDLINHFFSKLSRKGSKKNLRCTFVMIKIMMGCCITDMLSIDSI